jgi:hypothetical protein
LLFDTGAAVSVLDASAAQELELEFLQAVNVGGGTEDRTRAGMYAADFRFGGTLSESQPVLVLDLRERGGPFVDGIDGILSPRTLPGPLLVDLGQNGLAPTALPDAAGRPFGGRGSDLPVASVQIGQTAFEAVLDSGASDFLLLPLDWTERYDFIEAPAPEGSAQNVAGTSGVWRGRLRGEVSFGGRAYVNPEMHVVEGLETPLLGRIALSQLVIVLDYEGRQSWILPATAAR